MRKLVFLADLGEFLDRKLQILPGVGRGNLGPDPGCPLWHHRIKETDDIDSQSEKSIRHFLGKSRVSDHDRNDRMSARPDSQPAFLQPAAKELGILFQPVAKFG